jgi:hypothetical protein
MELEAGKGRRIGMELLTGYITVGTLFTLYGLTTLVVCVEMVAIGKDLVSLRNK